VAVFSCLLRSFVAFGMVLGLAAVVRADLHFAETTIDVGEARSGVRLGRDFRFVNDGSEEVELIEAQPSCGCLTPRLEQRLYRPGEQGTLTVEINTLGQPAGQRSWRVRLRYRKGGVLQETALEIAARVVTEVTVQPAALTVLAQGALAEEIVLTDLREQPLTLYEVRTTARFLKATAGEPTRDGLGHHVTRIKLEVGDDCPEGRHEEVLTFYTNDLTYRELAVPVTVVRRGRQQVSAVPEEITVRALAGEPVPSQLVRVRAAGDGAVVVHGVTADDPSITCRWASGPENCVTLKVQIDRTRLPAGGLRSAVHIQMASPVRETLTLPVSCTLE
jgi:uncharacterized protein DUF1573